MFKRGKVRVIATILLAMLVVNPTTMSALHGGSNWYTDHTYFDCRNGDQWVVKSQHRHIGGKTEHHIVEELRSIGTCAIGTIDSEKKYVNWKVGSLSNNQGE